MSYFHEEQSFGPIWIVVLLVIAVVPGAFLALESTRHPVPFLGSVLALAIFAPIAVLFLAARLIVDVGRDAITVSFHFLWPTRRIALSNVRRAHVTRYDPLADYGGWGVRYGLARGWAFTTGGHDGVLVELNDGRRVMIGSRRADELARAIARGISDRPTL